MIKLYEKSKEPFWEDEHISKSMLKAHLDQNTDRASRKLDTIKETVNWIIKKHENPKRILDLGCGPGLYTKEFFDKGPYNIFKHLQNGL